MYVPDNLDQFKAYSDRQESALSKLPECAECGQPIQDEQCYYINDEFICCNCMSTYKVYVDDFIN